MRVQSLALAAASIALLAPATRPVAASAAAPGGLPGPPGSQAGTGVSAADLLDRVRHCTPVSRARFRTDDGAPATVPVCATDEVVFWTADMDIDCDGRPSRRCNRGTDPYFSAGTAYPDSAGRPLDAARLPYVVVPVPSHRWDHREHGVGGGTVAAVVYRDRVQYAVVGDRGPRDLIGEASYATAEALGIDPDPHGGGVASGVTYILFRDSRATPIESADAAREAGERLAGRFVRGDRGPDPRPIPAG